MLKDQEDLPLESCMIDTTISFEKSEAEKLKLHVKLMFQREDIKNKISYLRHAKDNLPQVCDSWKCILQAFEEVSFLKIKTQIVRIF